MSQALALDFNIPEHAQQLHHSWLPSSLTLYLNVRWCFGTWEALNYSLGNKSKCIKKKKLLVVCFACFEWMSVRDPVLWKWLWRAMDMRWFYCVCLHEPHTPKVSNGRIGTTTAAEKRGPRPELEWAEDSYVPPRKALTVLCLTLYSAEMSAFTPKEDKETHCWFHSLLLPITICSPEACG